MKRVLIIPARGGSKRIPDKNLQQINGASTLEAVIRKCKESTRFNEVQVSTDSPRIAEVAQAAGATVPFMRSPELSGDETSTEAVIRDHIVRLALSEKDRVFVAYSFSLAISDDLICQVDDALTANPSSFIATVYLESSKILRALSLGKNQALVPLFNVNMSKRSQELERVYSDGAQLYAAEAATWLNGREIFTHTTFGVVIDSADAIDVDTPRDFERLAERWSEL